LSLSDLWESQGRSDHKLYDVNRNGPEFSFVENLFMETMRNYRNSSITCIQRVENGLQHDAYKVQRRNMAVDITKAPGTVSSGTEHQFVTWLFHGTGQENIEHIVNSQATGYLPMLACSSRRPGGFQELKQRSLEVILSIIVLSAAHVLPQSSAGMVSRAAAKESAPSEDFGAKVLRRGFDLPPLALPLPSSCSSGSSPALSCMCFLPLTPCMVSVCSF